MTDPEQDSPQDAWLCVCVEGRWSCWISAVGATGCVSRGEAFGANCIPPDAGPAPVDSGPPDASPSVSVEPFPTAFPFCDTEQCFCEALADCAAAEEQEALPLGSRGRRVCGERNGECVVTAFSEVEGGATALRCRFAAGTECPVDTSASSPFCEVVTSCNLLMDDCPPDLLDCEAPPTCDAIDRTGFGDCQTALGFGFDGTGCVPVSGCGCEPSCDDLHETRDACYAACDRSCAYVEAAHRAFVDENRDCSTDEDCTWVESFPGPYDHCSCVVAVNRDADIGTWRDLNASYGCFERGACCRALPGDPVCNDGACGVL